MSVNNLKANLTNPARTYLWDVLIPNPVGGGDAETLMLRAQSTSIPGREQGQILVPFKQSAGIEFPGKLAYEHTWTVTFIEGEDRKVFDSIYAWLQNVVHDADHISIGDISLKTDILLSLITTKGDEWMRIKLLGCYPKTVGSVDMTYANEGVVNFNVTFSFDSWVRV
jgi:hypothetical protein